MGLEVDKRELTRLITGLNSSIESAWKDTGTKFKNITPVRTGNARNKTKSDKDKIVADYPYAVRLDEGHSRQAPQGMTEPSIEYFENQLDKRIRRI